VDEYLNLPERGFTNYLSSKDLKLEDLSLSMKDTRFYVRRVFINPAELLMSKKVDTVF
jgi:hypothetical protein